MGCLIQFHINLFKGKKIIVLGDTYMSSYKKEDGTNIFFKFQPLSYVKQTGKCVFWAYSPNTKKIKRIFYLNYNNKEESFVIMFEEIKLCSMLLTEKVTQIKTSDIYR